ncbi:MAG: TonB family protein, partial [Gammaproteobacteria bacterium]|nr:TonB family protein [Gammaproteobacteria bacterium]
VLLAREFEESPDNPDAEYLAQQNLAGAGNTLEDRGLQVAYGQNAVPVAPGPEQDGSEQPRQRDEDSASQMLYSRSADAPTLSEDSRESSVDEQQQTGLAGDSNSVEILATPATQTLMQGAQPRQLIVSANTRESRIATYLDSWKRRIERVGTMNFPRAALIDGSQRNPVLEVSIAADGRLDQALILTSSGNRELDMAAVEILRLASPFDPFPEYLRNDYDALKFSYEWRFRAGTVGRMQLP